MATFVGIGPALDLDGPLPVRPEHSLLETPGVVVSTDNDRWMNGVNIWPYPSDTPSLWEPCADGTFRVKADAEGVGTVRFDALVAYLPITCSAIGFSNEVAMEFGNRAVKVLDATISKAVESALAYGVTDSNNAFFNDLNLTVLGGTESAGVALSYLENAIGVTGRKGMIHATPAQVAALQAFPIGGEVETRLITANGTPVVSGDGYISQSSTPSSIDTTEYMYATGPVEVRLGPVVITDVKETLERDVNVLTFRAERYFLATWDGALQSAVLVDWTT